MEDTSRLNRLEDDMKTVKHEISTFSARMATLENMYSIIIETQGHIKEKLQDIILGKTYICGQQQQKLSNVSDMMDDVRTEIDKRIGRIEGMGISLSLVILSALVTLFLSVFK